MSIMDHRGHRVGLDRPSRVPTNVQASVAKSLAVAVARIRWIVSSDALRSALANGTRPWSGRVGGWAERQPASPKEWQVWWECRWSTVGPVGREFEARVLIGAAEASSNADSLAGFELASFSNADAHLAVAGDGPLTHLHLTTSDGEVLLSATIRGKGGPTGIEACDAMYATTPVLGWLGLGGGRYELEGATIEIR